MRAQKTDIGRVAVALAFVLAATTATAQQAADGPPASDKRAPGALTLSGCVERGGTPNEFTIDDATVGKYRVSGSRINRYVGQRVEVVGSLDNARLKIRGGLYPSPNAAGQAGSLDPVKSAMAAQPGGPSSGTGSVDLPAFKVKSVKTLSGGCR